MKFLIGHILSFTRLTTGVWWRKFVTVVHRSHYLWEYWLYSINIFFKTFWKSTKKECSTASTLSFVLFLAHSRKFWRTVTKDHIIWTLAITKNWLLYLIWLCSKYCCLRAQTSSVISKWYYRQGHMKFPQLTFQDIYRYSKISIAVSRILINININCRMRLSTENINKP